MIILKTLLLLLVVAVGVLVTLSNPGVTQFDYLIDQTEVPTAWLLVASLAAGALLGALVIGISVFRWRRQARHWQREAEVAQRELANLRSLPLNSP